MRVLITGIAGFVGSHLVDYLAPSEIVEIHGTTRPRSNLENIKHQLNRIYLHECNITDAFSVDKVIAEVQPDKIVHLAAQSFVPMSWNAPQDTMITNIIGTINLLEAVKKHALNAKILIAGSSEEYGLVLSEEMPIKEDNPLRPLSPYGVSKVAQELIGLQYAKSYGLNIVTTRAFNHEGPRRGEVFITSRIAKQIVEVELGIKNEIRLGNLEAIRDFTDVRDIVVAYWMLCCVETKKQVYNICSGKGITIQELLEKFLELSKIKNPVITIDPELFRPSDVPVLIGDSSRITSEINWSPTISLIITLRDMLEYWREKIGG